MGMSYMGIAEIIRKSLSKDPDAEITVIDPKMEFCDDPVVGEVGRGKHFLTKDNIAKSIATGMDIQIINPDDEYTDLCNALDIGKIRSL